jgi:hypothetical protein
MKKKSVYLRCFVREIEKDGKALWILVDANGVTVCEAKDRSDLFFFALEVDHLVDVHCRGNNICSQTR